MCCGNLFLAGDLFKLVKESIDENGTKHMKLYIRQTTIFENHRKIIIHTSKFSIPTSMQLLTVLLASASVAQAHYNFNALIYGGTT